MSSASNPKTKGALHRMLHIPEGDKIPTDTLRSAADSDNPLKAKRANLALRYRGLADGGVVGGGGDDDNRPQQQAAGPSTQQQPGSARPMPPQSGWGGGDGTGTGGGRPMPGWGNAGGQVPNQGGWAGRGGMDDGGGGWQGRWGGGQHGWDGGQGQWPGRGQQAPNSGGTQAPAPPTGAPGLPTSAGGASAAVQQPPANNLSAGQDQTWTAKMRAMGLGRFLQPVPGMYGPANGIPAAAPVPRVQAATGLVAMPPGGVSRIQPVGPARPIGSAGGFQPSTPIQRPIGGSPIIAPRAYARGGVIESWKGGGEQSWDQDGKPSPDSFHGSNRGRLQNGTLLGHGHEQSWNQGGNPGEDSFHARGNGTRTPFNSVLSDAGEQSWQQGGKPEQDQGAGHFISAIADALASGPTHESPYKPVMSRRTSKTGKPMASGGVVESEDVAEAGKEKVRGEKQPFRFKQYRAS